MMKLLSLTGERAMSDEIAEMKKLSKNTWKVVSLLKSQSSGASIHLFVEEVYGKVVETIELLSFNEDIRKRPRTSWERKTES